MMGAAGPDTTETEIEEVDHIIYVANVTEPASSFEIRPEVFDTSRDMW